MGRSDWRSGLANKRKRRRLERRWLLANLHRSTFNNNIFRPTFIFPAWRGLVFQASRRFGSIYGPTPKSSRYP